MRTEENSTFVVHRGKMVPTLYDLAGEKETTPRSGGSIVAAIKERFNMDTKAEDMGENQRSSSMNAGAFMNSSTFSGPAGVPSNLEDQKIHSSGGTVGGGRRSRRNSIPSDNSYLKMKNFGGSQDNSSMFGRNPDEERLLSSIPGHYADHPLIFPPERLPPLSESTIGGTLATTRRFLFYIVI